jgi:hypothetical protein
MLEQRIHKYLELNEFHLNLNNDFSRSKYICVLVVCHGMLVFVYFSQKHQQNFEQKNICLIFRIYFYQTWNANKE